MSRRTIIFTRFRVALENEREREREREREEERERAMAGARVAIINADDAAK